ncbi:eukaryotic translation initiation factor 2 subunit alpha [Schizopora paradoxa]|uniref:Eukaryotic translation initiation factor 2 subunit alpha n=1 Tax=Schizopora paradoxa TaxID=27342 RepID=A0A0H2RWA8_9AGAM|nr:eukaryotic translation initiation factor 2 subunit alpha [Schizopora paradoxa]
MRFYENKYPEVDDLVMVQVKQIQDMGAYVKLLEYDNIEGMILLSELSRRRIRSIQKIIRVGRNEVVVVLRVDKEKGYIDLSKRRVTAEEKEKCEDRFNLSRQVASILREVASKLTEADFTPPQNGDNQFAAPVSVTTEEEKLEQLYEQIAWPLGRQYGHPHAAFKLMLSDSDAVFGSLPVQPSPAIIRQLKTTIGRKLAPKATRAHAKVDVSCYTRAGIDAIKRALRAGEKVGTDAVPIKARVIAPPRYMLETNTMDGGIAVDRLERAIQAIQAAIEKEGGTLVVHENPKVASESDEQELKALMAKAEAENAEVAGDDDSEAED